MKKKTGVFIAVFLAGVIWGATQPGIMYGGESGGGKLWENFVDTSSFTGTKISGPLSIYYQFTAEECGADDPTRPGHKLFNFASLYLTVRLSKAGVPYRPFYASSADYEGFELICYSDIDTQVTLIKEHFLKEVVGTIFPGNKGWKVKSISNDIYNFTWPLQTDSGAFVADIVIAVKE